MYFIELEVKEGLSSNSLQSFSTSVLTVRFELENAMKIFTLRLARSSELLPCLQSAGGVPPLFTICEAHVNRFCFWVEAGCSHHRRSDRNPLKHSRPHIFLAIVLAMLSNLELLAQLSRIPAKDLQRAARVAV